MTIDKIPLDRIQKFLTNLPPGATIELLKGTNGEVIVTNQRKTREQLLAENFSHLRGLGISMSQAAQKYQVPRGTLQRWVYRTGYVHFVDEEAYPKLVDEAEVALCADIQEKRREWGVRNVPFFDDEGYLIEDLKHPDLAAYRRRKRVQRAGEE